MSSPEVAEPEPNPRRGFLVTGLVVEGGLGVLAVGLGWLIGQPVWRWIPWSGPDAPAGVAAGVGWGIVATAPMLLCLVGLEYGRGLGLGRLREVVVRRLVPLFAGSPWWQWLLLAIAAGWGEELLFRGLIQAGLASWIGGDVGPWFGLVVAALLFGVCHWLTHAYTVLAAAIGIYLGLLLIWTDNLLVPVVAHAAYDFVALWYLLWRYGGKTKKGDSSESISLEPPQ